MPYFPPFIDGSGLHVSTYQDIEDLLVAEARSIFGEDIYLGNDSQDFQDIAARAKSIFDTLQTAQLAYNARSPVTSTGVSLDFLVALNGVVRQAATNSIANVTITGTAFTVISNGVVADINGNLWDLPASVTIEAGGTVATTVTAQLAGAITALSGQINLIITPTLGWTSVTNALAATPGLPPESDSSLRARQAISVANPSQALTTGILGAVLAVENVLTAQLYENDTHVAVSTINGVFNPGNYPPNSITIVVDGGADIDVGIAIGLRKTPGCYTNGTTAVVVTDTLGVPTTIRFYRPTPIEAFSELTITPLTGYTSAIVTQIKTAVTDYIESLTAGSTIVISEIWAAALTAAGSNTRPFFSLNGVTANVDGDPPGTIDIPLDFNIAPFTSADNIDVIVL